MLTCQINSNLGGFSQLVNNFVSIVNAYNNCSKYFDKMLNDYKTTINLLDHIHKCHLHPYMDSHNGDEFPSDPGIRSGCTNITCIDRLVRELMESFDVDDNGLVYGKDFIFSPDDPDVPKNIKANQIQYEIRYERLKDTFLSFEQYFSKFNVLRRCLPKNPLTKLILQLILNENPDDVNSKYNNQNQDSSKPSLCANKVYGRDFIIDPDDPNKPQELIELEKHLSIDSNIKKIKYIQYLKECTPSNDDKALIGVDENGNPLDQLPEPKPSQCDYVCTRLVAEWLHMTDIDGNGKIYGKDFKICDDDPMKCRCLQELEMDIDWNTPFDIMTWEQFCNTFPNNNPDDRHENK